MADPRSERLWLQFFRTAKTNEDLLRYLDLFLALRPQQRDALLAFFEQREIPYAFVSAAEHVQLARDTDVPDASLVQVVRFIRYLLTHVAIGSATIEAILAELKDLGRPDAELNQLLDFIKALQPALARYARRDVAASQTLNVLQSVSFSADLRAVYEEGGLTDLVPVLLVRMRLSEPSKPEPEHQIVFQLSSDSLDRFCERLLEQKAKLKELTLRAALKGTPPSSHR